MLVVVQAAVAVAALVGRQQLPQNKGFQEYENFLLIHFLNPRCLRASEASFKPYFDSHNYD